MSNSPHKQTTFRNQIDYIAIAKSYLDHRNWIFITAGVFAFFGLIFAYSAPEEYVSTVKLMPENSTEPQLGGLSNIARQIGVGSAAQSGGGIPASLYPDVAKNLVMMKQLMDHEVQVAGNDEKVTLHQYFLDLDQSSIASFIKKYTIGLPGMIFQWLRSLAPSPPERALKLQDLAEADDENNIIQTFTVSEWAMIKNLRNRVSVTHEVETGVIYVEVKMPDPILAAQIASQVVDFLIQYITDYRTEKTRKDVEFIEQRLIEAKSNFEEAQRALASYTDRQRATKRALDNVDQQRLENEFSIAFNVYNTMAQRLEEAKIRLQEVTPVVSILDPPAVPEQRSEPMRMRILATFLLAGLAAGVALVYLKLQVVRFSSSQS